MYDKAKQTKTMQTLKSCILTWFFIQLVFWVVKYQSLDTSDKFENQSSISSHEPASLLDFLFLVWFNFIQGLTSQNLYDHTFSTNTYSYSIHYNTNQFDLVCMANKPED